MLALRAGCGYEQLVHERICRPLGLQDTGVAVPLEARHHFAQGQSRRGRPVPHSDLPALAGAGALRSTVADLIAFLRLQLGEGEPALARLQDTGVAVPLEARHHFAQGQSRRGRPVPHSDLPALAGAGALRSTVADLIAFRRLQLGEGEPALARATALTHTPRARHRRAAIGLGWTRLPLLDSDHELLFHNGGTGGCRSFVAFVPATHTAVVALSNSARSVDTLGFRILQRL